MPPLRPVPLTISVLTKEALAAQLRAYNVTVGPIVGRYFLKNNTAVYNMFTELYLLHCTGKALIKSINIERPEPLQYY